VQVAFVDDISEILNVPEETLFILDETGAPPPDKRQDLGAEEDISTIQQFLGQPMDIVDDRVGAAGGGLTVKTVTVEHEGEAAHVGGRFHAHGVEDQPSEDIDEIQKFLERSQADQPDESPTLLADTVLKVEPPPAKYKIPKSPEFKKRFQNKEIVKIVKGSDSHKNYEKIGVKKMKPVAPSFEDQLHEAELIDIRTTMEKKRKWKNKSSTRDYMITKKYAKNISQDRRAEEPRAGKSENLSPGNTDKR
jgi:hypothetical protein